MRCVKCNAELLPEARFCSNCGSDQTIPTESLTPAEPKATDETGFVPASASFPESGNQPVAPQPMFPQPQTYLPIPTQPMANAGWQVQPNAGWQVQPNAGWQVQPAPGWAPQPYAPQMYTPIVVEGDYYHFDAREKPDFEALRGISIILLVLSLMLGIGLFFPAPLAIISLIKSCNGTSIKDPDQAAKQFRTCRLLVILTIIVVILLIIGLVLLAKYADVDEMEKWIQQMSRK